MFGIVLSALNAVLAFVLRSIIVKFVVFFALFFVTTEFMAVIVQFLPTGDQLTNAFGGIPNAAWYFLNLFNIKAGIPLLLSAYVTRFTIRRIPLIG
ncbi:DUF2523 family protein [Herbaspirillum huttiense F1]|uniref:DUF2523 family protein n=1 Tax=Herbaspirillum huttiense TaxID=863372 RepID=UPI0028889C4F|nr:DUF2523 family protein [Herbaspirillum huttiense]MDT0358119.1 DUF2523 family protein [Herbaspirillum huttiense F1]